MPFTSETCDAIMGILELPVTVYYVQQVQDALAHAEVHGGDAAVARIENYVAQYQVLENTMADEVGNASLIKADVLEWTPGGKTAGHKSQMSRLQRQIASSLLLKHLNRATSGVRVVRV